jgi:hypothetical protein
MTKLIDLLKSFVASAETLNQRRAEAYLAQSVDNFDLERRMRELERRPRQA